MSSILVAFISTIWLSCLVVVSGAVPCGRYVPIQSANARTQIVQRRRDEETL